MIELVRDLSSHVRGSDLLDVGIVTFVLYVTFVWLRHRASRSLGIVAFVIAATFLLARWLDLYLTTMIFHYGLLGIVLALVIVFQNDIRHGFERLAASPWFNRGSSDELSQRVTDAITEVIATMASQRIGALLVFPGREPLDRHVRGGVKVDAEVSLPLLLSIFHPKSPGHDGAVLIEQNRISQLGLHLPLSTQIRKVHNSGTRHAAALGLAECCDAIVLAVSEERGTITIGQNGELNTIAPTEVAERLRQYFSEQSASSTARPHNRTKSWSTMLAAFASATALWFLFAYRTDTIQRTYIAPIEYRNLSKEWEIAEPKLTHAEITLSGTEPGFALLDPQTIAVSLDFKDVVTTAPIRWKTETNLTNVPAELNVEQVYPPSVVVSVRAKTNSPNPE